MNTQPPPVGSTVFLQSQWDSVRSSGIAPLNVSTLDNTESKRAEFLEGARLLGLGQRRMPKVLPQMLVVADALNANPRFIGILEPRRSSKTTTLFAAALGRCASRQSYLVSYTMLTTAIKARARFKNDVAAPLEALFPDPKNRPFKISYAGGSESIRFDNGSLFQVLPPKGEGFRSDAWDLVILDEGGEATVEMSDDVLSGLLATMDTRPDATLVVAGTAGLIRTGNILWDTLEDGRAGKKNTGIVEYAAPADTALRDILDENGEKSWALALPLLLEAHPGIGTLTTLEVIEANFDRMTPTQFLREYLSIFATVGGAGFLDIVKWTAAARTGALPEPPKHWRLSFKVHPLQTSAAIVGTWREDGKAVALVIDQRKGVAWVTPRLLELSRRYKVPIVFDNGNNVDTSVAEELQRAKPRPQLEPQNWNAVSSGAATLVQQIDGSNVIHFDQEVLNTAVKIAVKRATRESKRWAFGRGNDETGDITSLEAWSIGLHAFDESKPRQPMQLVT